MALRFLDHGGEMGRRIRDHDWSATPFGPIETWPTPLRTALGLCLGSTHPTAIYWGPELRLLYNDAWAPIPAERHPACLGQPAAEVWQDIWDVVGPQFAEVMQAGNGLAAYDQPLSFLRGGERVDTWFTYSLTPIRGEDGEIVGIFNQGNETTRLVLAERNRRVEADRLRDLFRQAPGAAVLLTGRDFTVEFANTAYLELIGHRDIVGKPLAEAVPEIAEAGVDLLLEEVWHTGEAHRDDAAEIPVFRDGHDVGEIRLLDIVYQPVRDEGGLVTGIFIQANDVTERARAERALRDSDERLQMALGSSLSIGTWDWDVTNDRVTADARFANLYSVDPDLARRGAAIDRFFGGIHPDDLPRVQAAIEDTLTSGVPFIQEYRLAQPDGSVVWVVAQGRATFDDSGRAVRFPGISFDITERRLAEDAARAAADELRAATEAQDFIYRVTAQMRRLGSAAEVMRHAATVLGCRLAADRVGFFRVSDDALHFEESWWGEDMSPATGIVPLADLNPGTLASYRTGETRIVANHLLDGPVPDSLAGLRYGATIGVPLMRDERWVSGVYVNQARPRRWTADEVSLVEAVAEAAWDAVDRAAATTALRESEAKFRGITNSIDQMVWSARPDGYHDYFNDRWYDFTGTPHGSTDGDGWNDVFHPDDRARAVAVWQHSLQTGEPYRIEYRLRHRDGRYRWVLGSALPVYDDGGSIVRWFGTCTDIQEIVEAREVLARSRQDLEHAVVKRTEQLMATEAQLRQAQKMEAVGQLTGGIAHDFNNMLAVVIGALDLLERRVAQGRSDVARYVEAARDGATRAAALTQRLLSFSRQTALDPAPVDINALVGGMTELLSRTLGEATQVSTDLADDTWVLTADRSQLENAIINLAVNARDAMPRGGHLIIATANRTVSAKDGRALGIATGDYVRVTVTDTGEGMDSATAARAFDPFFTTKSVGKGTGLGLSQVFGFVHQSGGQVDLRSAPGEGTSITILLPRDTSDRVPAPTPSVASEAPRALAGETVLVVEDEERVRNFSIEALRELGYAVVDAPDGPSALRLIDAGTRFDLLFTDVVMPGMNGSELADAARTRVANLRVLFTSGYTRDAVDPVATADGPVLNKPFDVATLATRVRSALDGRAAAR